MGRMYAWQNGLWTDIGSSGVAEDVYVDNGVPPNVTAPDGKAPVAPKAGAVVTKSNTVLPVGPVATGIPWTKVAVATGVVVAAAVTFKLVVKKSGGLQGLSRRRKARR